MSDNIIDLFNSRDDRPAERSGHGGQVVDLAKTTVVLSKASEPMDADQADQADQAAEGADVFDDAATHALLEVIDPAGDVHGLVVDESGAVVVDGAVKAMAQRESRRDRERRPIVPAWMRDRETLKATVGWEAEYAAHLAAFHVVRIPAYWARLAVRSPIGLGRLTARSLSWVFDWDQRELRSSLTSKAADPHAFLRMQVDRRNQTRFRGGMVATLVAVVAVAFLLVATMGWLAMTAAIMATLAVLGAFGRKPGTRITGRATDAHKVPKLTADLIVTALSTLGLSSITTALRAQGERAVEFPGPITRDGPGWRADVDLPGGATAGEVIDRRSKLASGLRRPIGCVWPEAAEKVHEGRLVLWVGDKPLSESKQKPWPLAKTGKVNLFEPIVIGTDQRGRDVATTLMFVAILIGAVPRMGKTFLLRLLLLSAALDVRVELHVYDLKGGADLRPLRHVAHAFRTGDEPEDIEYLLADLRAIQTEMRRRYRLFGTLPHERCPESKVTDELCSDKSLGLHPIVVAMDECGLAFSHKTHGKEITEIAEDLVKRGPAAGIVLIPATQRIDVASVPAGVSANAVLRFALKVMDHTANDMILGSGMYKNGVRATMFARSDKGVALMVGEGDDPVMVRSFYIDAPAAETIALRARAARNAAGRLTGYAAGADVEPEDTNASILEHLAALWPEEDKVWADELAERLGATHPTLYAGWNGAQVTAALKRTHGVRQIQIKRVINGEEINKRGFHRDNIHAALYPADPA